MCCSRPRPNSADTERAAVAWLTCASADALRARLAFSPADRTEEIAQIHAHLVSVQMSEPAWQPAIQIAFVIAALGELVDAARPIVTADPGAHGPEPRFDQAVGEALLRLHPQLASQVPQEPDQDDTLDPVKATTWALEDVAHAAGDAAVLLHPSGPLGMPPDHARFHQVTRRPRRFGVTTPERVHLGGRNYERDSLSLSRWSNRRVLGSAEKASEGPLDKEQRDSPPSR
jgi:hypothetical protein